MSVSNCIKCPRDKSPVVYVKWRRRVWNQQQVSQVSQLIDENHCLTLSSVNLEEDQVNTTQEPKQERRSPKEAATESQQVMAHEIKFDVTKLNITPFDGTNWLTWRWKISRFFQYAKLDSLLVTTPGTAAKEATPEQSTMFDLILAQTMTEDRLMHVINLDTPKAKVGQVGGAI